MNRRGARIGVVVRIVVAPSLSIRPNLPPYASSFSIWVLRSIRVPWTNWRKRLAFRVPKEITEKLLLAIFKQKEVDVVFRDAIR